jgi:hypothetical protein
MSRLHFSSHVGQFRVLGLGQFWVLGLGQFWVLGLEQFRDLGLGQFSFFKLGQHLINSNSRILTYAHVTKHRNV